MKKINYDLTLLVFIIGFFGMPVVAMYLFAGFLFDFKVDELWNFVMYMVSIINIYNFIVISVSFYQSRVEREFYLTLSIFLINFILSIGFLMITDWKSGFYLLIAFIVAIFIINDFTKKITTAKQLREWGMFKS